MARAASTKGQTRIQKEKTEQILNAALNVFSTYGFRGSTIDQIATEAGLSKPNILYYFDGKDAIHAVLLSRLLETWLEPLEHLQDSETPIDEICAYVTRKLEMARDYPRESRLFANEILQGAPRIIDDLAGPLRTLTQQKADLIHSWIASGKIAPVDPHHLIFSIWSTTQHYADFDVQVNAVLGPQTEDRFVKAAAHLNTLFRKMLEP
ncbi:TetR family transcriptional regulator C-terminal domain-containing protein [Amylibacter sp. IMCC11727]|uniref:TetR family transcriptional regulator C-terminal domain-containing protein n=1 Tax=Amylibacter sp. IMCC11727 TaxID=3039851 RepID=UPI00244E0744|nr:TetR family transcriptional regulator C-terminal domain-containing protein [Amylibacter sp. IMCC11727]WGI21529.1 TetR family transcriptional regulator C-terminal domain-containing protein [Amylibacter sp. IMCC11727]